MTLKAATRNGARRNRIVILGGGFAGINAAMELAKLPVDITIVDRKNYHLFQPLLYQVALAVLSPADIAQPIRSLMRDHPNIDVLMDEAVGFDLPRAASSSQDGRRAGVRLSHPRHRFDSLLLRQGRLGQARSRPQDHRGCDRDPPPRSARLRTCRTPDDGKRHASSA